MSAPPAQAGDDIQQAARHLAEGRPDEAAAVLERLAEVFPAYVTAHVLLAKAYETAGRGPDALAAWHRAHFLMPGSPLVTRQRARLLSAGIRAATPPPAAPSPAATPPPFASPAEEPPAEAQPADTAPPPPEATAPQATAPAAPSEASPPPPPPESAAPPSRWRPESEWPAEVLPPAPSGPRASEDAPAASDSEEGWRLLDEGAEEDHAPPPFEPPAPAGGPDEAAWVEEDDPWDARWTDTPEPADEPAPPPEPEAGGLGAFLDLDSLIEQLENAPRIRPDGPTTDDGDGPDEEEDEVVSETLARIYEHQQQYEAAARAYDRLAREQPARAEEFARRADEMRQRGTR